MSIHARRPLSPPRPGGGAAPPPPETAHNLEHSIAKAGLPNVTLVGASPVQGVGLERLVRRVDVVVCSTAAAERVRQLTRPAVRVLIEDPPPGRRRVASPAGACRAHRLFRAPRHH